MSIWPILKLVNVNEDVSIDSAVERFSLEEIASAYNTGPTVG